MEHRGGGGLATRGRFLATSPESPPTSARIVDVVAADRKTAAEMARSRCPARLSSTPNPADLPQSRNALRGGLTRYNSDGVKYPFDLKAGCLEVARDVIDMAALRNGDD